EATQAPALALQGEAAPVFTEPQEAPAAAPVIEPELPPGVELPREEQDEPELIAASTATVQRVADSIQPAAIGPADDSLATRLAALTVPPAVPVSAAPVEMPERQVQSRGERLAQLEQQVNAMRIRMQEAQTIAASLNASLQKALETR